MGNSTEPAGYPMSASVTKKEDIRIELHVINCFVKVSINISCQQTINVLQAKYINIYMIDKIIFQAISCNNSKSLQK